MSRMQFSKRWIKQLEELQFFTTDDACSLSLNVVAQIVVMDGVGHIGMVQYRNMKLEFAKNT